MLIDLTDSEREICADRIFWLWKNAEIDARVARDLDGVSEENRAIAEDNERFYKDLYNKLQGGEDGSKETKK
jgi:hypothetical protein